MNENESWPSDDWFEALAAGQENVVAEFWESYGGPLRRVAQRQISQSLGKRVDPDDIVQSACRTFFRRAGEGEFECENQDELWRLMLTITLNKARMQARYHRRECRGVDREQSLDTAPQAMAKRVENAIEDVDFSDFLESVLAQIDDESGLILQRLLEGQTQESIATAMGCSERTVRRVKSRIREQLQTMLHDDLA